VAEEIKFVVVGHHTRLGHAQRLAALLDAHLLIDEGDHGANWNHRRAIEWAAEQPCRVNVSLPGRWNTNTLRTVTSASFLLRT